MAKCYEFDVRIIHPSNIAAIGPFQSCKPLGEAYSAERKGIRHISLHKQN